MSFGSTLCRFYFTVFVLLLAACAAQPGADLAPIASESDERSYRYLVLDNQLQVLLVSDPQAEKGAASLDVATGSRDDPPGREGLAHFLEHMLFLGTDKYPEAGEYQNFISAHGGSHNAYTSFEHTNYFFDVDGAYLEPALDRFAQFFVAPLFTAEYVEREKKAVHSEYLAKIRDERRRGLEVYRQVVNPEHPFSKFSVGTLETLADRGGSGVRTELIQFYRRHYSANQMALVVLGNEALDELERMVVERFDAVPNYQRERQSIETPLFQSETLPALVRVRPEQEMRELELTFPIPDITPHYRKKPTYYIGNLLGHEGEGSLLSWLKVRHWAEGLSAGVGFDYRGGATFNVTVKLTETGVDHWREVAGAVFQTLELIEREGLDAWRYREQQLVAEQGFRFQERSEPIGYVSSLAHAMQEFPVSDILRGPYLMEQFDPALIREFLGYLQPTNALVTLTAPTVETEQVSPRYRTEYAVEPVDGQQVQQWRQYRGAELALPEKNRFIARQVAIKPLDVERDKPVRIVDEPGLRVWYQQDPRYATPRGNTYISLRSPIANTSAEHWVLTELLARVAMEELNEFAYPATLAGLRFSVHHHARGITVRVGGFTERQPLLLERILASIDALAVEPATFQRVADEYRRALQNVDKEPPYRRALDTLPVLLHRHRWLEPQLLAALENVSPDALRAYAQRFLAELDIDMLVHGNYHRADALRIARQVERQLLAQAEAVGPPPVAVTDVTGVSQLAVDSAHEDAAALLYLQAAEVDKAARAALGVSAQMLRADFYTELRTEQQLGYVVMAGAYPVMDVPGIIFLVQSPVLGPEALHGRIAAFLSDWAAQPEASQQDAFTAHKRALMQRLAERPKNLSEATGRYWLDIAQRYYDFDSREQLLAAMDVLDYAAWRAYFERDVLGLERQLYLYHGGKFEPAGALPGSELEGPAAFKARHDFYEFE